MKLSINIINKPFLKYGEIINESKKLRENERLKECLKIFSIIKRKINVFKGECTNEYFRFCMFLLILVIKVIGYLFIIKM